MSWQERAACRDDPHPECWAAPADDPAARERARAVCLGCPVRNECLEDALRYPRVSHEPMRAALTAPQLARVARERLSA